jgi:hypothetical protein
MHRTEEKCAQKQHHLEELGIDGRIILECMIMIYDGKVWTWLILPKMRTSDGFPRT